LRGMLSGQKFFHRALSRIWEAPGRIARSIF
jgi:hypothetical protein